MVTRCNLRIPQVPRCEAQLCGCGPALGIEGILQSLRGRFHTGNPEACNAQLRTSVSMASTPASGDYLTAELTAAEVAAAARGEMGVGGAGNDDREAPRRAEPAR